MGNGRTAARVHLDRLAANVENIRARLSPNVELIAVLKGDAYGHGIAGVYPTLRAHGIRSYAVAYWEEGAALRQAGAATERIYLLADVWDGDLPRLLEYNLIPSVFSLEPAQALNALAERAGTVHPIQIKIDTGMHRVGFPADQRAIAPICRIAAMKHLRIVGAFTHFARADEPESDVTNQQMARFTKILTELRNAGVEIPFVHVANSPAILLRPDLQMDAVRAGDVLFGLCAVDEPYWSASGLREVMTWESYVAMVKRLPAGAPIGYGGTFVTERETVVATVPVGFVDGYARALSNRSQVRIRGRLAPVIGRVCMDQFMADVTEIPDVCRGDTVQLIDGEQLTIRWMADKLGTNVDEVVCGISKRVPRIYETGEIICQT